MGYDEAVARALAVLMVPEINLFQFWLLVGPLLLSATALPAFTAAGISCTDLIIHKLSLTVPASTFTGDVQVLTIRSFTLNDVGTD